MPSPMFMLFFAILCSVVGQVLLKFGMNQLGGMDAISLSVVFKMVFNPLVFSGMVCYGIGFIAYFFSLSKLDQSFAYPMFSMGYVLVAVFNWTVMREPFTMTRLAGVLVILAGVWLLNR